MIFFLKDILSITSINITINHLLKFSNSKFLLFLIKILIIKEMFKFFIQLAQSNYLKLNLFL